jgi:NAD(P)-dependent dehydrogenase (short-subunit alcohol dehydrogenase family)
MRFEWYTKRAESCHSIFCVHAQLEAFPGSYTVECDLSQPDSMARASTQILARTRHVGVLVHNAATVGAIQPMALVSNSCH